MELNKNNIVVGFYSNKTRGMSIQSGKASKDWSASFIVKANLIEEIIEKVKVTLNTLKELDVSVCELNFYENYINQLY